MIIQKLRWGRINDLADVKPIIEIHHQPLDWPYIDQWCEKHDSNARLDKVLAEIATP